jgi:hypothetical protein
LHVVFFDPEDKDRTLQASIIFLYSNNRLIFVTETRRVFHEGISLILSVKFTSPCR